MEETRNLEKISETMDSYYFRMQHFITESNWSLRQLMDWVAREMSSAFPQRLKASTEGITVQEYLQTLRQEGWQEITVRNTAKGFYVVSPRR